MNEINKIITCKGCMCKGFYDDVICHEQYCLHVRVQCEYCLNDIKRLELDKHKLYCVKNPKCIKECESCKVKYISGEDSKHYDQCLMFITSCKYCKFPFYRCELLKHYNTCEKYFILCEFCGIQVAYKDYHLHLVDMCNKYYQKCGWCDDVILFKELLRHKTITCNFGLKECLLCHKQTTDVRGHLLSNQCNCYVVNCSQCHQNVKYYSMEEHLMTVHSNIPNIPENNWTISIQINEYINFVLNPIDFITRTRKILCETKNKNCIFSTDKNIYDLINKVLQLEEIV